MSHYRTEIYARTKARLEAAALVAEGRVSVERVEAVTCRTAAEAASELPVINLTMAPGNRSRDTEAAPLKGETTLDLEVLVTGADTEAVAAARDALAERVENLLLGDPLAWSANKWKCLGVNDSVAISGDSDVLVGMAKLSFRLEITTVPTVETEDMLELVNVDVQTTEPDDESIEMSFVAAPPVEEE